MNFTSDKAIYLQIADRLCTEILMGRYAEDARIPSVREYAVLLEVNTNTTVKSYEALANAGVIYNKRGLGYFVSPGAKDRIMADRRKEFMEHILPDLFNGMKLLEIDIDEVDRAYQQFKDNVAADLKSAETATATHEPHHD